MCGKRHITFSSDGRYITLSSTVFFVLFVIQCEQKWMYHLIRSDLKKIWVIFLEVWKAGAVSLLRLNISVPDVS